jgi:probable F420-dependent oxidoreductase
MKFGAPMLAVDMDPAELKEFASAVEDAAYDYISLGSHLLCVSSSRFPERLAAGHPPLGSEGPFYDPFTVFAYMISSTERLRFSTGIITLPLLPTAMVARQAAELACLSGGRFDLGVSVGWNPLEYQAFDQDFHKRGRRLEEQIVVLRRFWTEPHVTFHGEFHNLDGVGLNRLPAQPIPIWIGGGDALSSYERLIRRVARLGDGWMPLISRDVLGEVIQRLRICLEEEGRSPDSVKVRASLLASRMPVSREIGGVKFTSQGGPDAWIADAKILLDAGVDEVTISSGQNFSAEAQKPSVSEIVEGLAEVRRVLVKEFGAT